MYQVQTAQFTGPLEKLLELIEGRKMEITEVSIGLVTDDFLKYLEGLKKTDARTPEEIRLLADFIVVASRLLLIKSKALLPNMELTPEEESDIKDLKARLQFYKDFRPAINSLKKAYEQKNFSASRPYLFSKQAVFYPPREINVGLINRTMRNLFDSIKQINVEFQTLEATLIKLEEKIEEIMTKIADGISNFGHLIKEKSKKEIVVMFLALLHLLREQTIEVEQTEGFSEIVIKKI